MRALPPLLAEKARVELNEDLTRSKDGLQLMKDWIAKQPHLRARTGLNLISDFISTYLFIYFILGKPI